VADIPAVWEDQEVSLALARAVVISTFVCLQTRSVVAEAIRADIREATADILADLVACAVAGSQAAVSQVVLAECAVADRTSVVRDRIRPLKHNSFEFES
jgi:hypothetical protein